VAGVKLKQALQGILPDADLGRLVRGYDVIGDVAVIIIPDEISRWQGEIAQALLEKYSHLRVVAKRAGYHSGEYRDICLVKIGGEGGFQTWHKEFGVNLFVDPGKVYYSPRSGTERRRVADKVKPGEQVLVMFSGIGPFPLMISKHSRAEKIIGIEKNPIACRFALKNLAANRKLRNVTLLEGDVRDVIPNLNEQFDRVVMPFPFAPHMFLAEGLGCLKPCGRLHYYVFCDKRSLDKAVEDLRSGCHSYGRQLGSAAVHRCGHISPGKYRICIDAQLD